MPIKNRIDMLTTGIRTPVGIKIFGSDLKEIEQIGRQLEGVLQKVPGTRSVYGERVAGGYFVDFDLKRREIARYGLTIKEVQDVIMTAIGGENVSTTIEGRERYPVNVRYPARAPRRPRQARAHARSDDGRSARSRSASSPTSAWSKARR